MNDQRIRIVWGFVLACFMIGLAPMLGWWSFQTVVHAVGTVSRVEGDDCYVDYVDRLGVSHVYINSGGKGGCSDEVNDLVDLYYDPDDPTEADTMSPTETRLFALFLLGAGVGVGAGAWMRVREGQWVRAGKHVRN